MKYTDLFKTFLKIGIVTFGGGYAMIPIIESEVVDKHHWMTKEEFLDAIATTQVCPGALAINMSSLLGYKLAKTPGAIVCTLGASLPSFLIILAIAIFSISLKTTRWWLPFCRYPSCRRGTDRCSYVLASQERQDFSRQLLGSYPLRPSDMAGRCQPHLGDYCRWCGRLHLWTVHSTNGVKLVKSL